MKDFRVIFANDIAQGKTMSESTSLEEFEIGPEVGETIKLFRHDCFQNFVVTDTNYSEKGRQGFSVKEAIDEEIDPKEVIKRNPKVLIGLFVIFFIIVSVQTYNSFKKRSPEGKQNIETNITPIKDSQLVIPAVSERGSAQYQGERALEKSESISEKIKTRK